MARKSCCGIPLFSHGGISVKYQSFTFFIRFFRYESYGHEQSEHPSGCWELFERHELCREADHTVCYVEAGSDCSDGTQQRRCGPQHSPGRSSHKTERHRCSKRQLRGFGSWSNLYSRREGMLTAPNKDLDLQREAQPKSDALIGRRERRYGSPFTRLRHTRMHSKNGRRPYTAHV